MAFRASLHFWRPAGQGTEPNGIQESFLSVTLKEVSAYEAVLFDFDGVLVDSEPVHFECWGEILKPFGLTLPWEYYEKNCIGVSDRAMIQTLVELADPPADFEAVYARYPQKKMLFREKMLVNPSISQETLELIPQLSKIVKVAVVTSSGKTEVEPILDQVGLLPYLQTAVFGGDVERLKPAPDPYLLAAERLNIKRALVVEDSQAGIASGRAAGFDVIEINHPREVAGKVKKLLKIEA